MINVEAKQKHVGNVAKRDPHHRFTGLYRTLCEETWLTEAWQRIRRNKGSKTAGVDGQTKDDVDDALIKRLAAKLRKEEFQPTPVRRVYIPKLNGKKRPLGIPTLQDRIVESALKMLLEPIYEQDFRTCSHGFRPLRSCMTALRDVAHRFPRSTWIIEGDVTGCYDNIHHGRLLSILRRRIRDEKLLGLIYAFLAAGYLEKWKFHRTYSGTPQGGIVSPLLANVYLHELDTFMEDTLHANLPQEIMREKNARRTTEGRRIENRITRLRMKLKGIRRGGDPKARAAAPTGQDRTLILNELKELEKKRKRTPSLKTRPVMGYVRYADDYLITLQQHSKAEAQRVKEQLGIYLKTHLHLSQSEEKTLITHPANSVRFLGYDLTSQGGRSKYLRLLIPQEKTGELLREVEKLGTLHHIDEADLILKVNAKVRGWMNYYRFASAPQRMFSKVLSKVFWQVAHYLATKNSTSIRAIMGRYSATVQKNGRKRLTLRKRIKSETIDLWMFPPRTENIHHVRSGRPETDEKENTIHEWARGRSIGKRIEALEAANYHCQVCGQTENLIAHHKGGLRGLRGKYLVMAGRAKETIILCQKHHVEVGHEGSYKPQNRGHKVA